MPAPTELDRLAAARPPLLDHTERVVGADQEDQILWQILCSASPAGAPSVAPARVGRARSSRSRLRAASIVAGVAAVMLAAVGVFAGTGLLHNGAAGGRPARHASTPTGRAHAISAETVADRTVTALTTAGAADVEYSRSVFANGSAGSTAAIDEWNYGITVREKSFNAQGSLIYDASAVVSHGLRIRRFVDYTDRTWQGDSIPAGQYGAGPGITQAVELLIGRGPAGKVSAPSRNITLVNMNGRKMFEVTHKLPAMSFTQLPSMLPYPTFGDSPYMPAVTGHHIVSETMWIDAATYLPVRVALSAAGGRVLGSESFAWLTPDRANRAELASAPIPPGFRETQEPAH